MTTILAAVLLMLCAQPEGRTGPKPQPSKPRIPELSQKWTIIDSQECRLHIRLVSNKVELTCSNRKHNFMYHVDPALIEQAHN